jgi:hypothetical protein
MEISNKFHMWQIKIDFARTYLLKGSRILKLVKIFFEEFKLKKKKNAKNFRANVSGIADFTKLRQISFATFIGGIVFE